MTGLVYLGEYSSACVCSVVGSSGGLGPVGLGEAERTAGAVAAGAAAGVIIQEERSEDASLQTSIMVR